MTAAAAHPREPATDAPRVEWARFLAARGLRVHPLHHVQKDGTCSCGRGDNCPPKQRGKHPRVTGWQTSATTDAAQIDLWWQRWPAANIGVATGEGSGVCVLDADGEEGRASLRALLGVDLPDTFVVETGSAGRHVYYQHPEAEGIEVANTVGKLAPKLDVRTERGNLVGPGSANAFGSYRVLRDAPIARLPVVVLERLRELAEQEPPPAPEGPVLRMVHDDSLPQSRREEWAHAYAKHIDPAISGSGGHDATFVAAQKIVRGFDLPEHAALRVLLTEWNPMCSPPWSEPELRRKVREAAVKGRMPWGKLVRERQERDEAWRAERRRDGRVSEDAYQDSSGQPDAPKDSSSSMLSPRLGESLAPSILRAKRRSDGAEKPIPLALAVLSEHFGGGLWPGLHVVNSGTGVGKTQLALAQALHSAKAGIPVLYIGLELGQFEIDLRTLALEAGVPWSALWTGSAGAAQLARAEAALPALDAIPFHCELARPMGYSATEIQNAVETFRAHYPETEGPGSRPLLVVVDFLQLVGDDPGTESDLRIRIARAVYVLRDAANRLGVAVLCISSIARERYKLLSDIREAAGLTHDLDGDGCPVNRRIADPDSIVGAGKESGEIEYSADSVSIVARVAETWGGGGVDVVFATAKGRATGAMWSPLHFTGFRYEPCTDRGGRIVQAWQDRKEKRAQSSDLRKQRSEQRRADKLDADARAIVAYVLANPGCTARNARANVVNNNGRRWAPAVERIGRALAVAPGGEGCEVNIDLLKPEHRPKVTP